MGQTLEGAWTVGTVLRRWREQVAGRTQRSAARELGVAPSLWSGWESGHEAVGQVRKHDLDRLFRAEGTLAALLEATTTPAAFAPRASWWFNVQGPSKPWWIWIRPHEDAAKVSLRWGPSVIPPVAVGAAGLVITTPVSMPNPPLSVCFVAGDGWVDMGPGALPGVLGLRIVDGVSLMRSPTPDYGTFVAVDGIRRLLGRSAAGPQAIRRLLGDPPFLDDVLAVLEAPNTSEDVRQVHGEPILASTGADFARARTGRGLGRAEAAFAVTTLEPRNPVSEHQIQRLEAGHDPRPYLLRSRLDAVYGADGHLGSEPVPVRAVGDGGRSVVSEVDHPDWWIGAVWFAVEDTGADSVAIEIEWGNWRKRVLMRAGQAVLARRPQPGYPLPRVTAPRRADVRAGIGRVHGAADINRNWSTTDERATAWLRAFTLRNYLRAFGTTASQVSAAVRPPRATSGHPRVEESDDPAPSA